MGKFVQVAPGDRLKLSERNSAIGRNELSERPRGQCHVAPYRQWKELIGVHRHERPGLAVHRVRPISLQLDGEKSSRPQAELLGIEKKGKVAAAPVFPGSVLAAT